jgi:hypothetical protein
MKWVRANDNLKAALLILRIGTISSIAFYLLGLHVWALIGLGIIPFAFGCWGLFVLLSGSRNRELYANMTPNEREQLTKSQQSGMVNQIALLLP